MGNSRKHYGHDAKEEGRKAGEDMRDGKISKDELKEKYDDAKFRGQGEEFREGYGEGGTE